MNKSRHAKLTIPTEKKLTSVSKKGFLKWNQFSWVLDPRARTLWTHKIPNLGLTLKLFSERGQNFPILCGNSPVWMKEPFKLVSNYET